VLVSRAMSDPSPSEERPALERLQHLPEAYRALPRAQREGIIYGVMVLLGLLAMPFLIWFAGSHVLGPYTHGENTHAGPFALLLDYFIGLLHGSAVFWAVALGPALLLLLIRLLIGLIRAHPPARTGE